MIQVQNPILSGFYPDPSICRVGEDFYLVNSSFAYYPGVPIFHSKDLANWTQIGNILDRDSQLPLDKVGHSGGIFAPTIRYHKGLFYMITTNVGYGGNFIVTATNPEGPWSEPYYLHTPGIDPSLFFDEDDTCYYVGTRPNPEGVRYNGDWEIWVQELQLSTMTLVGESHYIWKGAMKDVIWPEGPHLYKKDGYYYLMIAEGGTGPNHAVTVARSKTVFGPYENNPNNPILTHRHMGKNFPIVYVGHGDLVDDENGNWYMVTLASRRCEGFIGLGRETFLCKVFWEDGWPVVNPGVGKLEDVVELPFHGESPKNKTKQSLLPYTKESFDVLRIRNMKEDFYKVSKDGMKLKFLKAKLSEQDSPAYLGFRQLSYDYVAKAIFKFNQLYGKEEFGIVLLQSNEYHITLRMKANSSELKLQVVKVIKGNEEILAEEEMTSYLYNTDSICNQVELIIKGYGQKADFKYRIGDKLVALSKHVDIHEMSTEIAGGFVGNTLGVYTSSCHDESNNEIVVEDFTIEY